MTTKQEDVIKAVRVEPEDILEGNDPASRLCIKVVKGEELLWEGQDLPWGQVEIIVEELY